MQKQESKLKKQIEDLINSAQNWYTENSLLNNASKTEVMVISKKKTKENFFIQIKENGKKKFLKLQKSIKILGIHIDNELSWDKQVHEVNKKARFSARNLNRINQLLPVKTGKLLYNSLVASHLNYADTVWAGCNKRNKHKLQRTQNLAVKSILGMKKRESSKEALMKANLISLDDKRKVHEAVYTHKALNIFCTMFDN